MSAHILKHPILHIFRKQHDCADKDGESNMHYQTSPNSDRRGHNRVIMSSVHQDRHLKQKNPHLRMDYAKALLLITQF